MENQVRNKDRITHQKKQERLNIRVGTPTIKEVTQGVPQTWNIPNKGLMDVSNYNGKLYYKEHITWSDTDKNLKTKGTLNTERLIQKDPYHVFGGFQDESETISIDADTWTHITNAGNNLWTAMEATGFSFSSDELVVTYSGHYDGVLSITFEGGLTFDFLFRVYNVTQSVQSGYYIGETGRGVANYANVCVPIYLEATGGDHFQFQVYEVSGNDAAFYNAIFNIQYLHD